MKTGEFWHLRHVSDERLRTGLAELLASGYRTEARIIAHLAEVDERKLYLKDGGSSLFDYCQQQLGLSTSEAFHRITAARVARRFPVVFRLIEQRALHLTAVCLLRDFLTRENHQTLLAEASHKTKIQVQELLARHFPRPDVESRIRKLPQPKSETPLQSETPLAPVASLLPAASVAPVSEVAAHRPSAGAVVEPLSETRYRIQLNASVALKEKLARLQALTRHSNPSGDLAVVIERALDAALEQVEKRRFAKTARPRSDRTAPLQTKSESKPESKSELELELESSNSALGRNAKSRNGEQGTPRPRRRAHIPNAIRRQIAGRDEMRCTYEAPNGCRCTAQAFLQIHHERPWARGGDEQLSNLRMLCAAHNRLLAEKDFGASYVAERQAARRNETRAPRCDRASRFGATED